MTQARGLGDRTKVSILLVDDYPPVRQGLRLLLELEPDARVVGEAGCASDALAQAVRLMPDIVIMDVETLDMDGITTIGQLLDLHPTCVLIGLTMQGDSITRTQALAAGAWTVIEKGHPEELLVAFRHVATSLRCQTR